MTTTRKFKTLALALAERRLDKSISDIITEARSEAGVAVMERLRALPGPVYGVEDGPDVHGVGGHVQYVRLGADGSVVNEIIHEWPEDVPGQKVGAASKAALVA